MKWVSLFVGIIIIIICMVTKVVPIMESMMNDIETPEPVKTLISYMPIALAIVFLVLITGFVSNDKLVNSEEEAYYLDQDDVVIEPGTLKVRDAKQILKIRYAKGEIDSLEYSERMSKL